MKYAMNAWRTIAAQLVIFNHVRPMFFVYYANSNARDALTVGVYALTSLGH